MAKKTAGGTLKVEQVAKKFTLERIAIVRCSAENSFQEGGDLPTTTTIAIQAKSQFDEEKKQIVGNQHLSLEAYPDGGGVITIDADFQLVYRCDSAVTLTTDELGTFSQTTMPFDVWPYWREFVQSITTRMNLPALTLGHFSLNSVKEEKKKRTRKSAKKKATKKKAKKKP